MVKETLANRHFESAYMNWAKFQSHASFNLATSGVPAYPLAGLEVGIGDLEIGGPTFYGYQPLLEAVGSRYGVSTDCIVLANGCSGANHVALSFLLRPGDDVLIEEPTYELLTDTSRFTGANILRFKRLPEQGWLPDFEEIERTITPRTTLIAVTNLHNPTSALLPEAAIRRLSEIAARHGAYLLIDEAYLDAVWSLQPQTAFHLADNILVTGSLTKVYGLSGLRCGWIFAPADLAKRLWRMNDLFSVNQAHPAERLSVIAIQKISCIEVRSRALIDANHAIWKQFVPELDPYLECEIPRYGTVTFPRVRAGHADDFCQMLRNDFETSVVPGRFFSMPDRLRISLVTDPNTLRAGLTRIIKAFGRPIAT